MWKVYPSPGEKQCSAMPNGLFPSLGVTGNKPVEKLEPNTIMEWQECQGAKVANKCKNWISEGDLPTRLLFHYYNVYNTTVYPVNGIRAFFTLQQCGLIAFWAFFFFLSYILKKTNCSCSKVEVVLKKSTLMPYLYFLTQVYRIHKVHMVLRTPNEIYTQTNLNKLERDFDL